MSVKKIWSQFKELILVLAGIVTIATFVMVYMVRHTNETQILEKGTAGKSVSEEDRKEIDSRQCEFSKRNPL